MTDKATRIQELQTERTVYISAIAKIEERILHLDARDSETYSELMRQMQYAISMKNEREDEMVRVDLEAPKKPNLLKRIITRK